ncbi:protein of unknown function (plasmid) [Vibrio harveyi]|nr:protein of unknown function [Vibrio harveyi]CAH1586709.1 protein of unknown function [Vibrio harveyi]CAH1592497.1 protein of unknown function [Vibrio harveyi]
MTTSEAINHNLGCEPSIMNGSIRQDLQRLMRCAAIISNNKKASQ